MERKRIDNIRNRIIPAKEKELAKLQAARSPNATKIAKLQTDIQDLKDEATVLEKQLADRANDASDYLSGKTNAGSQTYTPILTQPEGEAGVGEGSDYAADTDAKIQSLWTAGSVAAGVILFIIGVVVFLKRRKKRG